jgi:hypothetical protein
LTLRAGFAMKSGCRIFEGISVLRLLCMQNQHHCRTAAR